MIKKIKICVGAWSVVPYFEYYAALNHQLLESNSILFPENYGDFHANFTSLFCRHTARYFTKENLDLLCKQLENKTHIHTLCFSIPFLGFSFQKIRSVVKLLSQTFDSAEISFFCNFVPQEQEIEAYRVHQQMFNGKRKSLKCDFEFLSYKSFFLLLKELSGGKVHISDAIGGHKAIAEWKSFLDISPLAEDVLPSRKVDLFIHRDVLAFIRLFAKNFKKLRTVRWIDEAGFWEFGKRDTESCRHLSKSEYDSIVDAFSAKNKEFSKLTNCRFNHGRYFSNFADEALSFERFVEVGAGLSVKFVQQLLAVCEDEAQGCAAVPPDLDFLCDGLIKILREKGVEAVRSKKRGFAYAKVYETLQPKVAVLTLTYNHAAFIEDCLKSVLEQKTDFPVVHFVADDCSTDDTQDIILEYSKKYPQIVPIIQNINKPWRNVYSLLSAARTPYVALCDGDDYFSDPDKLQRQADYLDENSRCGLCFHPVKVVYEDGTNRHRIHPDFAKLPRGIRSKYYLSDLLKYNFIQTNSVMYRWLFTHGIPDWFYPRISPADYYWHILHAQQGYIGFDERIMSVYRRHKKAVYYSSENNVVVHRHKHALHELKMFAILDKHFEYKYKAHFLPKIHGIFNDCVLFYRETGDDTVLNYIVDRYPQYAASFLKLMNDSVNQSQ